MSDEPMSISPDHFNDDLARLEYDGEERRRGYPQTWMDAIPPWARVITIVGIPGTIALFLVWMLAKDIPQSSRQHEAIALELKYQRERNDAVMVKQDQLLRQLQRICSNTAKTDFERQRCFDN